MADEKNRRQGDIGEGASKEIAGKGNLDDEMLPSKGEPVEQRSTGGESRDTAGEHGDMAPETAAALQKKVDEQGKQNR